MKLSLRSIALFTFISSSLLLHSTVYAQKKNGSAPKLQHKDKRESMPEKQPDDKGLRPIEKLSDPDSETKQYQATLPPKQPEKPVERIFHAVEEMPEPGYDLNQYINENLNYPESELQNRVQGRVLVQFIVSETGKIRNAIIKKSLSTKCDAEALRVVNAMPKWKKPARQNGVPIHSYYSIVVNFYIR